MTKTHSEQSSYREKLLEHLFVGELLRHLWQQVVTDVEVLKPEVDNGGYDLVVECNNVIRHVQLKSSFREARTARQNLNLCLTEKLGGCIVWIVLRSKTLAIGPYRWFCGDPGEPFPEVSKLTVAKYTKGDASGTKNERPNIRVLPQGRSDELADIGSVAQRLFGKC